MKKVFILILLHVAIYAFTPASASTNTAYSEAGFYAGEDGLNPSERAGREIWYKATAGNDRFHTYTFPQRIGVLIDWFRVLNSQSRNDRFAAWGLINDPSCCTPGTPGCAAKNLDETYGFDWCEGDEHLLPYVGNKGYRDPACDFKDAPVAHDDPHGPMDQRQSSCDLKFGSSAGALGLRKFPNPRFDRDKWLALNGKLSTWSGFNQKLNRGPAHPDAKTSRLSDGSIEPPFRFGMACGTCHIAFNPENPPDDPANPGWGNILGAIGNQYARVSELMVSGMPTSSLEWQVYSHARPGTTDTSAVPTDQVNNPGTQNAIFNLSQRPTFLEDVTRWRKTRSCNPADSERECWCEPDRTNKCWRRSTQSEQVQHVLKGGGDSIGLPGALQRVYIGIGSCAEQCWVNHLTDLRVVDPNQRNFGQTPFSIGQCRRDCASFRAVEDRLPNIAEFLLSKKTNAVSLATARENEVRKNHPNAKYRYPDLVNDLEQEFGPGSVQRGRTLFTQNCARCHSSQEDLLRPRDFHATNALGMREDFLGSNVLIPLPVVDTFPCRAMHSNHMNGHIWEEFSSETYRRRPQVIGVQPPATGGRGYYRAISLLGIWSNAPFLHNNAVGPELCGNPNDKSNEFYHSPYVDTANGKPIEKQPDCWEYDPSVEGRYKLYCASMRALLNPADRPAKVTTLSENIILDIGPKLWDGEKANKVVGFTVVIPKGKPNSSLGNFQHKPFIVDLISSQLDPKRFARRIAQTHGAKDSRQLIAALDDVRSVILTDPSNLPAAIEKHPYLIETYSSCTGKVENDGHRFGERLSAQDKDALIAFLATL